MEPENGDTTVKGFASARIVELLETVRTQTMTLAGDADSAQQHKAEAAALGEIATGSGIADGDFRRKLNAIVQSASNSDSLFQLGELRRRYVAEATPRLDRAARMCGFRPAELAPYERIFDAQTQYLLEMFAIRAAVSRLHSVSRELFACNRDAKRGGGAGPQRRPRLDLRCAEPPAGDLGVAALLVLVMAIFSIRSVMRVSRDIVALSSSMGTRLHKGEGTSRRQATTARRPSLSDCSKRSGRSGKASSVFRGCGKRRGGRAHHPLHFPQHERRHQRCSIHAERRSP